MERISASRIARSNVISGASARTTSPSTKLMTTIGTRKVSHFGHKSHRDRPYDPRGGDLSKRVRPFRSGRERSRRRGAHTLISLLVALAISWIVLGPSTVIASASGASVTASQSGGGDNDDLHHRCGHGSSGQVDGDDEHCCHCCAPPPKAPPGNPPNGRPKPPPAPAPRQKPAPGPPVTAGAPPTVAKPTPPAVSTPSPGTIPVQQQPPVIAPPALTVPPAASIVTVPSSPVSVYVVTLSTLAVAAAISVTALILVRHSD